MAAMISSVRKMPCSMVVMPASIASAMPVEPCACAAVRRPAFVASSTAARISSSVSCGEPGSTPGVITPPVAMSLMTSTPALSCSRTALRTSSGPSASRPTKLPWPPVMHTGAPRAPGCAARERAPRRWRGERTARHSRARPGRAQSSRRPRPSRCARRSALSAVSAGGSSLSARTGSASAPRQRCTWQLMSPGRSVQPERSMRRPRGARASSTTCVMRSALRRRRRGRAPAPHRSRRSGTRQSARESP